MTSKTTMPRELGREIVDFTAAWRFHKGNDLPAQVMAHGNLNFIANETKIWQKAGNHALSRPDIPFPNEWRLLDLPHDFVLEGEFTPTAPLGNGSLSGSCAWYVKHFSLPVCDQSRRISVAFDGVYRDCQVFCNGHFVGRHMSGYTSFSFDITEVCEFGGENAIAVFVDARENELWSYEGGGIYRGVRLVKTAPIHIPQWGVCVRTGGEDDPGRTDVAVTVRNRTFIGATVDVNLSVLDGAGNKQAVATTSVTVDAMDETTGAAQLSVASPALWSIESPTCYTLVVELAVGGEVIDRYEQVYGYRFFRFDAATGFYLNGQPLKLKGTCCHQDSGCVGVAVPPDLQAWRVRRLKSYGCNAIRTSHNPPDPALLDACDRLGMLVMDEVRVPGISREQIEDAQDMVRRDRNHPSVILWSLGNEEMSIQNAPVGIKIFSRLQHAVKHLDPTRPTVYGCNCNWIDICDFHDGLGFRFDVWGANYRGKQRSENYDDFHARYPDWPLVGTETWGGASTRGLYVDDGCPLAGRWRKNEDGWADDKRYVSGYANWCTPWGYSIEETWQDCASRPFMAGTFIWTGFDYRGETSPYAYPAVITRYGILDLCGFYKPVAHYLRSWWLREEPHIFLLPHWNWEGREGEPIDVRCYANTADVELFLNGNSLGRKTMPVNGCLDWDVPYAPGELRAIGYASDGAVAVEVASRTAGPPAAVHLDVEIEGDIAVVSASIVDVAGTVCPLADDEVIFDVTGPARLLGVGNGNPISHEPDQGTNRRKAYHGLCQAVYRTSGNDTLKFDATVEVTESINRRLIERKTTQQRLTDRELVAKRRAGEKRLDDFTGMPVYLQGLARGGTADMYDAPEQRLAEALEQLAEHVELLRDESVFRPLSIRAALHGVHFVDKIFGAEVFELDGEKDNWQGKYLGSEVGTLKRPDLDTNPTWTAARAFARSFVASGVTVPAFQLPTIASALNIGLNLYGQDILMAMMTDPSAAHRDLAVINSVLLEIHDWYRATVPSGILQQVACSGRWQPPGCGQICGCSTQLISADQYADFIAHHDDAILSRYPRGGMIHLCGTHTQHIPVWKKMQSLRAVQVNDRAAEDLEIYLCEMPEKIYYVHPCEGMPIERIEKLAKTHKIVICAEPPQVTKGEQR